MGIEIEKEPETLTVQKSRTFIEKALSLMQIRDAKYGEAWREMRLSSLVDIAVAKFRRCTKLVDNPRENADKIRSDLYDMINYACFSLIKLEEMTALPRCFLCDKDINTIAGIPMKDGKPYHPECYPEEEEQ